MLLTMTGQQLMTEICDAIFSGIGSITTHSELGVACGLWLWSTDKSSQSDPSASYNDLFVGIRHWMGDTSIPLDPGSTSVLNALNGF